MQFEIQSTCPSSSLMYYKLFHIYLLLFFISLRFLFIFFYMWIHNQSVCVVHKPQLARWVYYLKPQSSFVFCVSKSVILIISCEWLNVKNKFYQLLTNDSCTEGIFWEYVKMFGSIWRTNCRDLPANVGNKRV